jgi:N-acetylglucosaminyldiphosphoundecaprenol N-acetyl-beta-D-mannosaminyltransferase
MSLVHHEHILGMRVGVTNYQGATGLILDKAKNGDGGYVCVANVHMIMEAYDDPNFKAIVNNADLVTPDGMPLIWMLRRMGYNLEDRVYGPTLTLRVLEAAAIQGIPVGFYGGKRDVLEALIYNITQKFPGLKITFKMSPPFQELSQEEKYDIACSINASGTRILFVGLGCPKQEKWMASQIAKNNSTGAGVQAVMIGVGAAFDFHANRVRQAPAWMQSRGLEWLFRLLNEPRRLWKRYIIHNPRFVMLTTKDLFKKK